MAKLNRMNSINMMNAKIYWQLKLFIEFEPYSVGVKKIFPLLRYLMQRKCYYEGRMYNMSS